MNQMLRRLASNRLTLAGMIALGVGAALNYDNPVSTPVWVLVIPLSLLGLNLCAAVISDPRINRRGGLLVFHLGLLAIVVLAALGRLTHMQGRIELTEGDAFSPGELMDVQKGPWHTGDIGAVNFVQGPYTVDYAAGLARGPTRSQVQVPDGRGGWERRIIGDDTPLLMGGYRIYTTFNKGFAPILTWIPDRGDPVTGAVHMPSYPLFEHRQANRWTPADGEEIHLWLEIAAGLDPAKAWRLDPAKSSARLIVRSGGQRIELEPGETARLEHGSLRYERLSSWMGYKLFYDPTLHWMFLAAVIAIAGLAAHFWRKFGAVQAYAAAQETSRGRFVPSPTEGNRP
jgi:cytochrome c biogenesis protein ResB